MIVVEMIGIEIIWIAMIMEEVIGLKILKLKREKD